MILLVAPPSAPSCLPILASAPLILAFLSFQCTLLGRCVVLMILSILSSCLFLSSINSLLSTKLSTLIKKKQFSLFVFEKRNNFFFFFVQMLKSKNSGFFFFSQMLKSKNSLFFFFFFLFFIIIFHSFST